MPESFLHHFLQSRLQGAEAPERLVLGFSGGMDSTALLLALANLRSYLPPLMAIHVHHGLSPHADSWAKHCLQVAQQLGVPLVVSHVQVEKGGSREAQARAARHQALRNLLQPGDALLLAHHLGDQAETILFRLTRGTGIEGLSAMRAEDVFVTAFGSIPLWRPWLGMTRECLRRFVVEAGVTWIEDESNDDPSYSRNYLRHEILPRLEQRWPGASLRLAALAGECQAVLPLIQAQAGKDLQQARQGDNLRVSELLALSAQRRYWLVREWLSEKQWPVPGRQLLEKMDAQLLKAAVDAEPCLSWSGVEMHRYRDELYVFTSLPAIEDGWSARWDLRSPLSLPDGRQLMVSRCVGQGIAERYCQSGVTVRYRQGGESIQLTPDGPRRPLKKVLQERGVPPWQRQRLPLLWADDELLAVVGLVIDAGRLASETETGWLIHLHCEGVTC